MNEKIKEIIEKSGLYIAHDNKKVTDKEIEFFAEMIVRECARVVDRGDGSMSSMAETSWCNICRDDILKHFGIEE